MDINGGSVAQAEPRFSRVNALRALYAGIDARAAGQGVGACPHLGDDSLEQQFVATYWVRGWLRAGRPDDYTGTR